MSDYATVTYPDYVHAATDPNRMGAIARCHGIQAPGPGTARVLEIGCGPGGNLLSLASIHPGATLVGIDLEPRHVAAAQRVATAAGLENISLISGDLNELQPPPASFDYIIAHGIYSWVSPKTRRSVLRLCRRCLSPDGVAFLSFNANPGWRQKSLLRDIARQVAQPSCTPAELLDRTDAWLKQLCHRVPQSTAYGMALRESQDLIRKVRDPEHFFHEHLEATNDAFGFGDFCRQVAEQELRCFAEATLSDITAGDLQYEPDPGEWPAVQERLDYLTARTFHRCLLSHENKAIQRPWGLRTGLRLALTKPLILPTNLLELPTIYLADARNRRAAVSTAHVKELLLHLQKIYPGDYHVEATVLGNSEAATEVRRLLEIGILEVVLETRPVASRATPRPKASSLTRYRAGLRRTVSNFRHEPVELDATAAALLTRCDGTREAESLATAEELSRLVDAALLEAEH